MSDPVLTRDNLILLVRRIDWRFLLPSPVLKSVGYFGKPDETHLSALRHFSEQLTIVPQIGSTESAGNFDVAILSGTEKPLFSNAVTSVKSGGYLYWEIQQSFSIIGYSTPNVFARQLRKAGFSDIRCYWHRPSFQSCKEIIPLDHPAALQFAMDKGHTGFKGQLKQLGGTILSVSKLLPLLTCPFSIVARKSPEAQR